MWFGNSTLVGSTSDRNWLYWRSTISYHVFDTERQEEYKSMDYTGNLNCPHKYYFSLTFQLISSMILKFWYRLLITIISREYIESQNRKFMKYTGLLWYIKKSNLKNIYAHLQLLRCKQETLLSAHHPHSRENWCWKIIKTQGKVEKQEHQMRLSIMNNSSTSERSGQLHVYLHIYAGLFCCQPVAG